MPKLDEARELAMAAKATKSSFLLDFMLAISQRLKALPMLPSSMIFTTVRSTSKCSLSEDEETKYYFIMVMPLRGVVCIGFGPRAGGDYGGGGVVFLCRHYNFGWSASSIKDLSCVWSPLSVLAMQRHKSLKVTTRCFERMMLTRR